MIKNLRCSLTGARLAALCGVSQGTVDRALHGRKGINKETREHILRVAKQYGFVWDVKRSEASDKQGLIGIVVFDISNEYFSNLIMEIERTAREMGYAVSVMFSQKNPQNELDCIESLYRMGADGIILCPVGGAENDPESEIFCKYLKSLKIPVVTVGNRLKDISYVGIDNYGAMRNVTEYVLERGYDRLIYVSPDTGGIKANAYAQITRRMAFEETVKRSGLPSDRALVCSEVKAKELLKKSCGKTALICPSDVIALRLFGKAKEAGAGIIGFDNISTIDAFGISLDSVFYDVKKTAENAVELTCRGYSEDAIEFIVSHKIVTRGSI